MLIKDLLDKQAVLDNFICRNNGYEDCYSQEFYTKRKLALNVELGEMTEETKCFKYWKKHNDIERNRLIDEVVDCIHFTLSLINLDEINGNNSFCKVTKEFSVEFIYNLCGERTDIDTVILETFKMLQEDNYLKLLCELIAIAKYYNYTAEEIVQAYDCKYEENIARQKRNY